MTRQSGENRWLTRMLIVQPSLARDKVIRGHWQATGRYR